MTQFDKFDPTIFFLQFITDAIRECNFVIGTMHFASTPVISQFFSTFLHYKISDCIIKYFLKLYLVCMICFCHGIKKTGNSDFCKLLRLPISPILKIQSFPFGYVDFYAKIILILYTPFENSTTRIAILFMSV